MATTATEVYHLSAERLRRECVRQGLCGEGSVRVLRGRLVEQLKKETVPVLRNPEMATPGTDRAEVSETYVSIPDPVVPIQPLGADEHAVIRALRELLGRVPVLTTSDPAGLLTFFLHVQEIYELHLVNDYVFLVQLLPLVSGPLLPLIGGCIREKLDWDGCRRRILQHHFPPFVRERLIRDRIVFNFLREPSGLREFVDEMFNTAHFLDYDASESQLVDRVVANLHPDFLHHASLLDKPRSRTELYLLEPVLSERLAMLQERRDWVGAHPGASASVHRLTTPSPVRAPPHWVGRCWNCNQSGHFQRQCPQHSRRSGSGEVPSSKSPSHLSPPGPARR